MEETPVEGRHHTSARISALEERVKMLADLLGGTLTALGMLSAHAGATHEAGDDLAAFRERLAEMQQEIKTLADKLETVWPDSTTT
jgi:glutamine synthetase type III